MELGQIIENLKERERFRELEIYCGPERERYAYEKSSVTYWLKILQNLENDGTNLEKLFCLKFLNDSCLKHRPLRPLEYARNVVKDENLEEILIKFGAEFAREFYLEIFESRFVKDQLFKSVLEENTIKRTENEKDVFLLKNDETGKYGFQVSTHHQSHLHISNIDSIIENSDNFCIGNVITSVNDISLLHDKG